MIDPSERGYKFTETCVNVMESIVAKKGTMLDVKKQRQLDRIERLRAVDGNVSDEGAISINEDEGFDVYDDAEAAKNDKATRAEMFAPDSKVMNEAISLAMRYVPRPPSTELFVSSMTDSMRDIIVKAQAKMDEEQAKHDAI